MLSLSEALISTDLQVLFDTVVRKLAAQGRRALLGNDDRSGVRCVYGNSAGERCALGHCFTEEAHKRIPSKAGSLFGSRGLIAEEVIRGPSGMAEIRLARFCRDLQEAHDESRTREEFCSRMLDVGRGHLLDLDVLRDHLTEEWQRAETW